MSLDFFKAVEGQYAKQLPFVVYRKPFDHVVHAIFQSSTSLHYTTDYTETGFVFAPFDSDTPSVLLQIDERLQCDFRPSENLKPTIEALSAINPVQKEKHIALVKKGIDEIGKGTFEKVVVSRRIEMDCSKNPIALLQELISLYESAFCYLWYHPKVGLWLGATPEILLRIKNKNFTTMSLAGTKGFSNKKNQTRLYPGWGKKETEEQALVTQYIVDALKDKVSDLKISEVESIRAGKLWHLRTKLSGAMKSDVHMIIHALHPTPAVCGMPMEAAKQFILINEKYDREFYTGFLGELNVPIERRIAKKDKRSGTELFVNLRCMQLQGEKAFVYVGGGVTADSVPQNEWAETVAKSMTLLRVLFQR